MAPPAIWGPKSPLLPAPNPPGRVNGQLPVLQCYYMWPSAVFVAVVVLSLLFSVHFVFLLFVNDRTGDPNSRGSKFFFWHIRGEFNMKCWQTKDCTNTKRSQTAAQDIGANRIRYLARPAGILPLCHWNSTILEGSTNEMRPRFARFVILIFCWRNSSSLVLSSKMLRSKEKQKNMQDLCLPGPVTWKYPKITGKYKMRGAPAWNGGEIRSKFFKDTTWFPSSNDASYRAYIV